MSEAQSEAITSIVAAILALQDELEDTRKKLDAMRDRWRKQVDVNDSAHSVIAIQAGEIHDLKKRLMVK